MAEEEHNISILGEFTKNILEAKSAQTTGLQIMLFEDAMLRVQIYHKSNKCALLIGVLYIILIYNYIYKYNYIIFMKNF